MSPHILPSPAFAHAAIRSGDLCIPYAQSEELTPREPWSTVPNRSTRLGPSSTSIFRNAQADPRPSARPPLSDLRAPVEICTPKSLPSCRTRMCIPAGTLERNTRLWQFAGHSFPIVLLRNHLKIAPSVFRSCRSCRGRWDTYLDTSRLDGSGCLTTGLECGVT